MIVCMSSGGLVVEAATRSPLILFSQPGSGGMMVVCRSWAPCRLRLCFEKTFVESSIGTCLQSTDPQSRVYLSSYLRGLCASTVLFPSAIFFTPNGRNNNRAVVHPLVLLSVTDHARCSSKRVVGVFMGQENKRSINVANSFGAPFEEDDRDAKTWFLYHNYIGSMFEMFKKVIAREGMIGWYHTGPKLRAADLEINELLKRFIARPVMVILDGVPRAQTVGIPTNAYFAVEEIKDDRTETRKTLLDAPSAIEAEKAEEIGVEHLLRDIKDSTTTLATRVLEQLAMSVYYIMRWCV
ncbi:JAB1/Mov34/MPN/PAD-1 ubiquitin protease domain containing protein [Lactarius tabidus]